MSSPLPNVGPSPTPSPIRELSLAELIRDRGAPLIEALEAVVTGATSHADSTASWALATAVELNLGHDRSLAVRETARLHEVGKLYAGADLLARPEEALGPTDLRRVHEHAEAGSRLAEGAGVPSEACVWLRHALERYDGAGLPDRLHGAAIPLESRIIRVACAFATSLPRAAESPEWRYSPRILALTELRARGGGELDRGVVETLAAVVERIAG